MPLGALMLLVFLPTGPTSMLLIESVPISLRARARDLDFCYFIRSATPGARLLSGISADWGYVADEPAAAVYKMRKDARSAGCLQPFHPVLGPARLEAAAGLKGTRAPRL